MLLLDVGSTYTKLAVLDQDRKQLIATACAPTTLDDVSLGFSQALDGLQAQSVPARLLAPRYACSSAAGGLRMVAVGLVPQLTVEAARRAALGAGARVVATYSFSLTRPQLAEIEALRPDIVLLAGGTDGGDRKTVIRNARALAWARLEGPVVFAGNQEAADSVRRVFARAGRELYLADNVMPTVSQINVDSVREVIRQVFLQRIVVAKGLDKISRLIDAIVFPTPLAVLIAARALARLVEGGLVVIDVGGATTDVHSVAEGIPCDPQVIVKGLPEPYAKRTVEGDMGVRHNVAAIVEAVGRRELLARPGLGGELSLERLDALVGAWSQQTSALPEGDLEERLDTELAAAAAGIAMDRHVGRLEELWTPLGRHWVQYGKDLTRVGAVIGTGGPLVYSRRPRAILERTLYDPQNPFLLKPRAPRLYVDARYALFAVGLVSQVRPEWAEEVAAGYLGEMQAV